MRCSLVCAFSVRKSFSGAHTHTHTHCTWFLFLEARILHHSLSVCHCHWWRDGHNSLPPVLSTKSYFLSALTPTVPRPPNFDRMTTQRKVGFWPHPTSWTFFWEGGTPKMEQETPNRKFQITTWSCDMSRVLFLLPEAISLSANQENRKSLHLSYFHEPLTFQLRAESTFSPTETSPSEAERISLRFGLLPSQRRVISSFPAERSRFRFY